MVSVSHELLGELANIVIVDFPGTAEDEIPFKRGETIVVVAKDDGFGDGWWTVSSSFLPRLSYLLNHFSRLLLRFSYCFILYSGTGWFGSMG